MSRCARGAVGLWWLALSAYPLAAQDAQTGTPPDRIDLTITAPSPAAPNDEACRRQREAALISGEIVVCGNRSGGEDQRITNRDEAQNRYAAATQGGSTPDVAGAGIFRGKPTVGNICIKGVFNCPKPPALLVDVRALPEAPPGSDADRIARGLAPLGQEATASPRPLSAQERSELGLPPATATTAAAGAPVSPAGSAIPAAPQ